MELILINYRVGKEIAEDANWILEGSVYALVCVRGNCELRNSALWLAQQA
jgi:hypothetical protein